MNINKIKERVSNVKVKEKSILVKYQWREKYVDASGLSERELLFAIIYAYNTLYNDDSIYFIVTKKDIQKALNWSNYKISKIVKSIPEIWVRTVRYEEGGLIAGKGYVIDKLT